MEEFHGWEGGLAPTLLSKSTPAGAARLPDLETPIPAYSLHH